MSRPRLSINFYLDTQAMEDYPSAEIATILTKVSVCIKLGQLDGFCSDSNGNTVGQWSITNPKGE